MTGPAHERWDELAAGYALHALEPVEEQAFVAHLSDCARCQEAMDQHLDVATSLAHAAPPAPVPPDLAKRIRSIAGDATVSPLRVPAAATESRWYRRPAWAAAAGIVALGALAGLGITLSSGRSGTPQAVVTCQQPANCHVVALQSSNGTTAARAVVRGAQLTLVVSGLAPNDAHSSTYVLWQLSSGRRAVAVGTFDVTGQVNVISLGTLPASYRDTSAFAISLEPGRTAPATPSRPVALGSVTS